MILKRITRCSITFIILLLSFPPYLSATSFLTETEAIDHSSRQGMLSLRIAKAYIMIGSDVNREEANKQRLESIALFEQQLMALMLYAPNDEIQASLIEIETFWNDYRSLIMDTPSKDRVADVLMESDVLLALCDRVLRQIEAYSLRQGWDGINFAGRQRILSQRIAALYMARAWGPDNEALNRQLDDSIQDFENGFQRLQLSAENTPNIDRQLRKIKTQWDFTKASFNLPDTTDYVPTMVSVTTESMLDKLNQLISDYVRILDTG